MIVTTILIMLGVFTFVALFYNLLLIDINFNAVTKRVPKKFKRGDKVRVTSLSKTQIYNGLDGGGNMRRAFTNKIILEVIKTHSDNSVLLKVFNSAYYYSKEDIEIYGRIYLGGE